MSSEQRAIHKVSKILSKLEPEVAARVARSVAEEFAIGASATPGGQTTREPRGSRPAGEPDDARPSFLQTEFRIAVGKELLDKERSGGGSDDGRRR